MLPLLQINNLQVDFVSSIGNTTAVKNISFTVNRGEIMAIVGESGSGKSVTSLSILRLLAEPPAKYASGEILFSADGKTAVDLLQQTPDILRALRGNQIAMIFQEPMTSLNPVFTCGEQVMEAIRLHRKLNKKEARERTIALFDKVKLPDPAGIFYRYPHQLSGGQKQRVMIAMAMSCQPALLICDEPTTALDVTVQKTILQLIRELQHPEKMGVIFITHDLGVVAEVADRAAVMYKGEIVEQGLVTNIFENPQHPYTKGLLACRPILHKKGERLPVVSDFLGKKKDGASGEMIPGMSEELKYDTNAEQKFDAEKKSEYSVTEKFDAERKSDPTASNVLMEIKQLNVWFPSKKTLLGKPLDYVKAVNDVSFDIYEGETLGLVGESGCGKTTLGRTLLRLIKPTSGTIRYKGEEMQSIKNADMQRLRKDVQIIFQDPYSSLNPRITIGSAISEVLQVHKLYSRSSLRKPRVIELLEKVQLDTDHYYRYTHEFSGGQRQRIVIARALALNPSFLVCDESVSALDVSVQAQVLNLLNDLKKEFGFTVVFISHDLGVVRYISDRILVMNKGKIEEIGAAEAIYDNPQRAYTQKLIDSIPGKKAGSTIGF